MSFLTGLFSGKGAEIIGSVGNVIDGLTTNDSERSDAKTRLSEIVMAKLNELASLQADVIQTEMKGNFIQRSWRPMLMLFFAAVIGMKWFGLTDQSIPNELEMELLGIIKLGLGGYVVGRSAEKIASTVTKNIDLPFLKKKDRKL